MSNRENRPGWLFYALWAWCVLYAAIAADSLVRDICMALMGAYTSLFIAWHAGWRKVK